MPKKRTRNTSAPPDPNLVHSISPGELPNPSPPTRSSRKRRLSTSISTTSDTFSDDVFLPRNVPHFLTEERLMIAKRRISSPSSRSLKHFKEWHIEQWKRISTPPPIEQSGEEVSSLEPRTDLPPILKPKPEPNLEPENPHESGTVVASGRKSTRKRKQSMRHQEEDVSEYEEALAVSGKRSSFKHFAPSKLVGFMYRKMFEVEFTVLSKGSGYAMLRRLGLHDFLHVPVPRFDKKLCDEFLGTFDDKTNSGTVKGKVVVLDPVGVARASRLPLGDGTPESEITPAQTTEQKIALARMLPDSKKCRGFNLSEAVYGRDTEVFRKVACMLSIKLQCRKECFHFAAEEVLLALDRSMKYGVRMNWAEYLCTIIIRACKSKPLNNSVIFQFGEWLSKVIRNKLDEPDESDKEMVSVPVTVDNKGAEMKMVHLPINVIDSTGETVCARADTDTDTDPDPESSEELKEMDDDGETSTPAKSEAVERIETVARPAGMSNGCGLDGNEKLREELRREQEKVRELEESARQLRQKMEEGRELMKSLLKRAKGNESGD